MTGETRPAGADRELELLLRAVRRALSELPSPEEPQPASQLPEEEPAGGAARRDEPPATIPGPVDLRRLFALAGRHRLVPLLCRELLRPGAPLDDEARRQVAAAQRRSVRRALAQAAELGRLSAALEERGIEVLALKGPELALELFGDAALRWSRDLDLLVRRRDVVPAARVLAGLGYERDLPAGLRLESRLCRSWIKHGAGQLELTQGESGLLVELHWKLAHPRVELPLEEERLFSGARRVDIGGCRVGVLPRPALLVYLCHHGSRHRWLRLHWLTDVAGLMRAWRKEDWRQAAELAAETGVGPAVGLAVVLAEELLAAPVPLPIAERRGWIERGRRLAATVLPGIHAGAPRGVRFDSVFARQRWGLELQTRWRHRLRPGFWLWPLALSKADLDRPGWPDRLTPVLYLARPLRGAAQRFRRGRPPPPA